MFGPDRQLVFLPVQFLIAEQILWLNIFLVRLDVFFTFRFHGLMGYANKIRE